jgi:hypothetical protein
MGVGAYLLIVSALLGILSRCGVRARDRRVGA